MTSAALLPVIYVTGSFRPGHPEVSSRNTMFAAGAATSGVALSTVRQAADLDYQLTVLSDGCLDADPEVHRVLAEKVFPRPASVVTVADWIASLPAHHGRALPGRR